MNIRAIGNYEIVLCDADLKRIKEIVWTDGLLTAREEAKRLLKNDTLASSYYISKIIDNSAFNVWSHK